jgi:hypothetical protein
MEYPGAAGAIRIVRHPDRDLIVGFEHACPCGCGKLSFIRLNAEGWAPGTVPTWQRTGDDLHMTLTPSIGIKPLVNGQYHWHGYLREGIFEEC